MDSDTIIGRLYKATLELEEQKVYLIRLIAAIKTGEIDLSRVTATDTSVSVEPA